MEVAELEISFKRPDVFYLFPIGDLHLGTKHCAEKAVRDKIAEIRALKNAYWIGMGDYCMPLQAEILTKNGFKHVSQLSIGEIVLAYADGKLKWTPLEGIYQSPSLPMIELKSKSFYAKCSLNHTWFTTDNHTKRHHSEIIKKPTSELKKHHRIIITAPLEDAQAEIKLSIEEAALLGWIVTDGYIRTKPTLNVGIAQSKEPFRTYLRTRFGHWFTKEYIQDAEKGLLERSNFNFKTTKARLLFAKCKTRPEDIKTELPYIVTRISAKARMSMLEAMVQAEGWMERDKWHFSQKDNPILEAFQILSTLCGFRLGLPSPNKEGVMQLSFIRQFPVDVANLKITNLSPEPAWCPKTKYGSWVMRLNGQIAITGNSECITPSDKRWDIEVISDWVEPDNIAHCLERRVVELLEPIKHKCLGLLEGNHEDSIRIHNHDDIQKNICEALSVKNLSYSCYYRLIFRRGKGHSHYSVVCMFTHGNGAPRTKGARMMNLLATMNEFEADLYAKGHLHDIITYPRPYLKLGLKNKIIESHRVGAITGSWVRSYKQNVPASYAEKAGYPPSAVGCPVFKIDPDERTLSVEG